MADKTESDDKSSETEETKTRKKRNISGAIGAGLTESRVLIARVVGAICILFAIVLALGAIMVALDANNSNGLVNFVLDTADKVDLGVFSREDGIKTFDKPNADVKNALFNWGIGAVVWVVVGRVLDRLIRP